MGIVEQKHEAGSRNTRLGAVKRGREQENVPGSRDTWMGAVIRGREQ